MWLHQELVPFFYSQHVQASLREGALMHVAPGKHEFLLGDALLVGVMSNEQPRREITFPDGVWLDYWDNRTEYQGGQTAQVNVSEDRSPVFVRRGAIIPMEVENDAVNHGSAASKGWRTLDIYPATQPSQAVVWDSRSFPPDIRRDRTLVYVKPDEKGWEIRLEGGPSRDTILHVWRSKAPEVVKADGKVLDQQSNAPDWERTRQGWWFDAKDQRLWIHLPSAQHIRVTLGE